MKNHSVKTACAGGRWSATAAALKISPVCLCDFWEKIPATTTTNNNKRKTQSRVQAAIEKRDITA